MREQRRLAPGMPGPAGPGRPCRSRCLAAAPAAHGCVSCIQCRASSETVAVPTFSSRVEVCSCVFEPAYVISIMTMSSYNRKLTSSRAGIAWDLVAYWISCSAIRRIVGQSSIIGVLFLRSTPAHMSQYRSSPARNLGQVKCILLMAGSAKPKFPFPLLGALIIVWI